MQRFFAPAKINLFLHINGLRDDGYHNIQTFFQLLDFGDELTFQQHSSDIGMEFEMTSSATFDSQFNSEDNLVIKAAKLIKLKTQTTKGVLIRLYKTIPVGAGLGGGSSNAATTLLALNKLWNCNLPRSELMLLGKQLGADVPLFIQQQSAFAEGIGELLYPIKIPRRWYIVVNPGVFVSTKQVFEHCELTRDTSRITIRDLEYRVTELADNTFDSDFKNDCQAVAEKCYPELIECRKSLEVFSPFRMTGTGSSYFATKSNEQDALQLFQAVNEVAKNSGWYCFLAQGIAVHSVVNGV